MTICAAMIDERSAPPVNWEVCSTTPADGVVTATITEGSVPLHYADVLARWRDSPSFCGFFCDVLAAIPFTAYFWETPPVTAGTTERLFEFTVLDSPALANAGADAAPFADRLAGAGDDGIAVFANIGADALLVAPRGRGPAAVYAHLAAFMRGGPEEQRRALWRRVALVVADRLSPRALWLSTSGMGVYWLHVRLDSRPKYYHWHPYTSPP